MLEEVLEAGDRALIFTQFTEMGEIIQQHLQETFGREVLFLHGGVRQEAARPHGGALSADDGRAARLPAVAEGGRHRAEPDRAPTTSSTSTAGGTPPSRTRRPTAPSASARRGTCRCTSSSAPARWRRRSTR